MFPLLLAAGEEREWKWAETKDNLKGYDDYILEHPEGAHLKEALERACRMSAAELKGPLSGCEPMFPRMAYYAVAARERSLISGPALAENLSEEYECNFPLLLRQKDRGHAVDGLIAVRYEMETALKDELGVRPFIDIDLILTELEEAVIYDSYEEIMKCSDQSAWQDTPMADQLACSRPYRERQRTLAQAMGDHAKYDFGHVHQVEDKDYRMEFWESYRKLAKKPTMVQVAAAYGLRGHAQKAMEKEADPEVADKIETVAIRLAGGGKPLGGMTGMPR